MATGAPYTGAPLLLVLDDEEVQSVRSSVHSVLPPHATTTALAPKNMAARTPSVRPVSAAFCGMMHAQNGHAASLAFT